MKEAVQEYQCPGCHFSDYGICYKPAVRGVGCASHAPGTAMSGAGKLFLGMPKGFDRTGVDFGEKAIPIEIFKDNPAYNFLNIPTWKFRHNKNTLIRGHMPRVNRTFLHILLNDNNFDDIKCQELTSDHLSEID